MEGRDQSPVFKEDGSKDLAQGQGTCLEDRREVIYRSHYACGWSERPVPFRLKRPKFDQTHSRCDLVWWKRPRARCDSERAELPKVELIVFIAPEKCARRASASCMDSIHTDESVERSSGAASSSSDHCSRRNGQDQTGEITALGM